MFGGLLIAGGTLFPLFGWCSDAKEIARDTMKLCRNRSRAMRHGVAVSELAVCMPVLVLIVLGTIESCAMLFLQQSLDIAAYEGARMALVPKAKAANVTYQCELILKDRGVNDATAKVTPVDFGRASEGSWLRVETSAPFNSNSLVGGWIFSGRTSTASVQMMKEQ